jgi:hypothetical protein
MNPCSIIENRATQNSLYDENIKKQAHICNMKDLLFKFWINSEMWYFIMGLRQWKNQRF